MTIQMNVAEAKAKLSELLDAANRGEEVVIARSGKPAARLVPIGGPAPRPMGFVPVRVDDSFFDPLDDAGLEGWE